MRTREMKNKVHFGNFNQMIKQELINDKYVRLGIYLGASVIGLFSIGFVFKAVHYAATNFKVLKETLKR